MNTSRGSTTALAVCLLLSAGADAADARQQSPPDVERSNGVGAIRFDNNTPISIPDLSTIEIPFAVAGITGVGRVTTSLHLKHSYDADLTISLVSPDNTVVVLSERNGGNGDDYGTSCASRTTFDDASGTYIPVGAAPFAGTFRPQASLSEFNGKSGAAANGTWRLRIQDFVSPDAGAFLCGSITIVSCDGACERQPTDALRISDFDGDGKSDVTVFRPSTGTWFNLRSGSGFTSFLAKAWGTSGDLPFPGDYDGDGKADFAVYRPAISWWFILYSSTNYTHFYQVAATTPGGIPVPGNYDYDLDGKFDVAMFNASMGYWWLLGEPGWAIMATLGTVGDIPVQGDYDGDGRTDPAIYRPSTALWSIKPSSAPASEFNLNFGLSTDIPMPGDYDGDGKADIAVYRPSTGRWFMLRSSTNFTSVMQKDWGLPTDTPVPGDYDGDGRTDLAVYRPSNGTWWVLLSSTNYTTFAKYTWGLSSDIPILRRP